MKRTLLLLTVLLLIAPLASVAQALEQPLGDPSDFTPLNNKDILEMIQRKVETQAIVTAIQSSPCTFDTFPPVLLEMKRRGVPEVILIAMVEAPYGPSLQSSSKDDLGEEPIYHYAEQLKQMGLLNAVASGRRLSPRQNRIRAARRRTR